ncbi:mannitol dehydrogenase family protein [Thalassotalea sp. PLHSN55]|uniref:mannitol dehydrogenase family protein n=1 Tax=Thalassotalea sp. PLHSN55 TaxID=3435888 RepID=UPI003F83CF14
MALLSYAALDDLAANKIKIPSYLNHSSEKNIGIVHIVHIGPGAFFRGHQAWYTHRAMELAGGNWSISCISLHSTGVYDALKPQNGLFTLAVLDAKTEFELIGSIQEVLVSHQDYEQVLSRLSNDQTRIVTLTITEKGYCLDSNGKLDLSHPQIKADLSSVRKVSAIGLLVEALSIRKEKSRPAFTVLSCDNLTDNGKKIRAALICYAQQIDYSLAYWLEQQLICPCSMVDSITPATDDHLRAQIKSELGVDDNWPIKREAIVQWVIEDILPEPKPAWARAGVTFTSNVQGFENAKLRLLNCPHSTLAYLGIITSTVTVYDAMQNRELVAFIKAMINEEITPSFNPPEELDVSQYTDDIFQRFRNPEICHFLAQIAWDGSQKLPMRILPIIEENLANNLPIDKLSTAVAAWCLFIRKRYLEQQELVDPLSAKLILLAAQCKNEADHDIRVFLQLEEVFGVLLPEQEKFVTSLTLAYQNLLPSLATGNIDWHVL